MGKSGACVSLKRHAMSMDNSCLFSAFAFSCEGTTGDSERSVTRRLREICANTARAEPSQDPDPPVRA